MDETPCKYCHKEFKTERITLSERAKLLKSGVVRGYICPKCYNKVVMDKKDKEFYKGFAVALSTLIRGFDQPSMAKCIMQENGITLDKLKFAGVASYDLKPIRKACK